MKREFSLRPSPGTYHNGVFIPKPTRRHVLEYQSETAPQPRCPACRTRLVYLRAINQWRCGDFPHCLLTISDAVIQEAIRRHTQRQAVSTGADQPVADGVAPTVTGSRADLHGTRRGGQGKSRHQKEAETPH